MNNKVTFLTVLKSRKIEDECGIHVGYSIYYPEYVYALQKQIEKHYKKPHRFICMTDYDNLKCESIRLKDNLPGWWSKIELFQPDLVSENPDDTFIYFDLDTCIFSDITDLVEYPHTMSALSQVDSETVAGRKVEKKLGSGLMAWRGDYSHIYKRFIIDLNGNIDKHKKTGDQSFIQESIHDFKPIQEITSGIINYKFELRDKENLPKDVKIIYFHAQHKPWRLNHKWLDQSMYAR